MISRHWWRINERWLGESIGLRLSWGGTINSLFDSSVVDEMGSIDIDDGPRSTTGLMMVLEGDVCRDSLFRSIFGVIDCRR